MDRQARALAEGRAVMLKATDLCVDTPGGRRLVKDLQLSVGRERVAVVGRNGVGKSLLLKTLAGVIEPAAGAVERSGRVRWVPQELQSAPGSLGERRRRKLERARCSAADLLLLDEPSLDLDEASHAWLCDWLDLWPGGLLVVSHDRRLLSHFEQFFVVREAGCTCYSGSFEDLLTVQAAEREAEQARYLQNLQQLDWNEHHYDRVRRRRQRKKSRGRVNEVDRSPSRALLNTNRSYAQVSQSREAKKRREKVAALRSWTRSSRQRLPVELPLALTVPRLPEDSLPIIELEEVTVAPLFESLSLRIGVADRLAVVGANGAGKTTLLEVALGHHEPDSGRVRCAKGRVGRIAQGAEDWVSSESLLQRLAQSTAPRSPEDWIALLLAHKFPLALAERPLASLSAGERVRAALLCLWCREPAVELLVLDEPAYSLDFVGFDALADALAAWPGGLLVASHQPEFLSRARVERQINLSQRSQRRHAISSVPHH